MRFRVRALRRIVCGASVASALLTGVAQAATCTAPGETSALQARVLQTELMVAALTCSQKDKYNAFIRRFGGDLTTLGNSMKSYFTRAHGRKAATEMNAFVTALANEASRRAMGYQGDFCGDANGLFDSVLAVPPKELARFAATRPTANTYGIASCQASAKKPGSPGS